MTPTAVMFEDWSQFYVLTGTAAATLIGLLFVVSTLTTNFESDKARRGTSVFMSPIVFHLTGVLILSIYSLVPRLNEPDFAHGALLIATVGLIWAVRVAVGITRPINPGDFDWSDFGWYGVVPALVYLAQCAISLRLVLDYPTPPHWFGGLIVAMLALSIRNAWDLVTFIAQMPESSAPAKEIEKGEKEREGKDEKSPR